MVSPAPADIVHGMSSQDIDHQLDRFAQSGDRQALEAVVAALRPQAFAHARRLLGRDSDAEDAVQEACVRLLRDGRRYRPSVPAGAWFAQLVHDACRSHLRAERRRRRREGQVAATVVATAPVGSAVDEEAVRGAVARLPGHDQRTLSLHYFAGLSPAEAAAALGVSEPTLRVRLHRAHRRLARHLHPLAPALVPAVLGALPSHAPRDLWHPRLDGAGHAIAPLPWGWILASAASLALVAIVLGLAARPRAGVAAMPAPPVLARVMAGDAPATTASSLASLVPLLPAQATIRWGLDLAALRAVVGQCAPLTLARDPRGATMQARLGDAIRQEIESALGFPCPRGIASATAGVAGALVQPQDSALHPLFLLAPSAPAATGEGLASVARVGGWQAAAEGEVQGVQGNGWCAGTWHGVGILADTLAVPMSLPAAVAPAPPTAPVWLHADLRPLVAQVTARATQAQAALPPGVGWLAHHLPAWEGTATPAGAGWRGEVHLEGGDLAQAWLPVRADLLAAVPPQALAALVVHADPARWRPALQDIDLPAPAAAALAILLPRWDGQLLMTVEPGGLLPTLTVVIGCDTVGLAPALDQWWSQQETAGLPASHARGAWSWTTPLGPVTVQLAAQALVLTTGADAAGWVRLLQHPDTSRSDGAAGVLTVDLPRVARLYLPLLIASIDADNGVDSDLSPEAATIWLFGAWAEVRRRLGPSASISMTLPPSFHRQRALLAKAADAFEVPAGLNQWRVRTILRCQEGYYWGDATCTLDHHTMHFSRQVPSAASPVPLERIEADCAGMTRIAGPPLTQLEPMWVPADVPPLHQWLDPAVLADHLVPCRVTLARGAPGAPWCLHEQGLPLGNAIGFFGSLEVSSWLHDDLVALDAQLTQHAGWPHSDARRAALPLAAPAQACLAALAAAAVAPGPPPASPAAFLARAHVEATALAALGASVPAGQVPAGYWLPDAWTSGQQPFWAFPVADGWWVACWHTAPGITWTAEPPPVADGLEPIPELPLVPVPPAAAPRALVAMPPAANF